MQNNTQDFKKVRIVIAVIAILIGVIMAIYGYMTLPAEVATQFEGFMNTGAPKAPKLLAVLLPLGIVVLFAVKSVSQPRSIFICLLGYVVNILFGLSN